MIEVFQVRFVTHLFLPPTNRVTLRNSADGWDQDVEGEYQGDAWVFALDEARYLPQLTFKFVLDGVWMMGDNLTIVPDPASPTIYAGSSIRFPGVVGSDPGAPGAPPPLVAFDTSGQPAIIGYNLPEPRSYRGRHVMELPFTVDDFNVPRIGQSTSDSAPVSFTTAAPADPLLSAVVTPRGVVINPQTSTKTTKVVYQNLSQHEVTGRLANLTWEDVAVLTGGPQSQQIVLYVNLANQLDYRVKALPSGTMTPSGSALATPSAFAQQVAASPVPLKSSILASMRPAIPVGRGDGGVGRDPTLILYITSPTTDNLPGPAAGLDLRVEGNAHGYAIGDIKVAVSLDGGDPETVQPPALGGPWAAAKFHIANSGTHTVSATATASSSAGPLTKTVSVVFVVTLSADPGPAVVIPTVVITEPSGASPIIAKDGATKCTVTGTANSINVPPNEDGTAPLTVQVAVKDHGNQPANSKLVVDPVDKYLWHWTADVLLDGEGDHTIQADCVSAAGQSATHSTVTVKLLRVQPIRPLIRRLFLVETLAITSYSGRYGVGKALKALSLLPGEKMTISVKSYTKTDSTQKVSQSILDSNATECSADFEDTLNAEQDRKVDDTTSRSRELEAHVGGSWGGIVKVDVSGKYADQANSQRQETAKNVQNAVRKHSSKASANRTVNINTETTVSTEQTTEHDEQRTLQNINVSRVLNFMFNQVAQEHIVLVQLVDIRIGLYSEDLLLQPDGKPVPGTPSVEMYQEYTLPEFTMTVDSLMTAGGGEQLLKVLRNVLTAIPNHEGNLMALIEDYQPKASDPNNPPQAYLRVIPNLIDTYTSSTGTRLSAPGIILAHDELAMATEAVLVDSILAEGEALDSYSKGLQEVAVREREAAVAEQQARIDKQTLALDIIRTNDKSRAELWAKVFPVSQTVLPWPSPSPSGDGATGVGGAASGSGAKA